MSSRLPDGWEMRTLGEVCEINPPRREIALLPDDLDASFVPMAAVSEDGRLLEVKTRKVGEVKKGFPHFKERDVLVAKITPCFEKGKRWLADSLTNGVGFGSTEFYVLRSDNKVLPEWIYYMVSLPEFRRDGQRRMTGTARRKRVPSSFLVEYEIPVPPLRLQERIVKALRRAERLKDTREQANQLTNKLIQSVFLKMFGDPATNPRGWAVKKLGEVCLKITDGTHVTPKYVQTGVPFLSVKDVRKGYLDFSDTKLISPEQHRDLTKRCRPEFGDVLYTKVGIAVGIAAPVDTQNEFSIFVSVALLKPDSRVVEPKFLTSMLNSQYVRSQAHRRVKGIGVPDLHLVEIKDFDIILPSMEMQRRFVDATTRIESLKSSQLESAQEINELFHSLMQKAFRGELGSNKFGGAP